MRASSGVRTAIASGVARAWASTGSWSRASGRGPSVALTARRRIACASGRGTRAGASQASSPASPSADRDRTSAVYASNMASATPWASAPSRMSQDRLSASPRCMTWQSSHTCGVRVTAYVTSGGTPSEVAPVPSALVKTTGISTGAPALRESSASTSVPVNSGCARSSRSCSPTALVRSAKAAGASRSTARSSSEVKSPTRRSMSSCRAGRSTVGTLSVKRLVRDQAPTVSAYAVSSAADTVSPRRAARSVRRCRSSAGSRISSRRNDTGSSGAGVRPGSPEALTAASQASARGSSGAGGRVSRRPVQ